MPDTCLVSRLNWITADPGTTFSGGSWVATATVKLANLLNTRGASYARTVGVTEAATALTTTFSAARRIDHFFLAYTNATNSGQVRVLPGGVPLDLDLTAQTQGEPPEGFTFTRSTEASYYDADGVLQWAAVDEPRYDHDPLTGDPLGFLSEPQAACLPVDSEDISAWDDDGATVSSNSETAPDGETTADRIVEKATTAAHGRTRAVTFSALTRYRISWFAKDSTRSWQCLRIYDGSSSWWAFFNASTGEFGHTSSGLTTSVRQLPGGWWRPCVAVQASAGAGAGLIGLYCATADGGDATPSYAGNTGNRIIVWGVMVEDGFGSYPTSYVRTTTSLVTRPADALILSGTGLTNIVPSGGAATLAAEFSIPEGTLQSDAVYQVVQMDDGTLGNRIGITHRGQGDMQVFVVSGSGFGTTQFFANGGVTTTGGTRSRAAIAADTNDARAALSGTLSDADVSVVLPVVTRLVIGGSTNLPVHVARVGLCSGRMSDAGLVATCSEMDDFDVNVPAVADWQAIVPVTHTPVDGYISFGRQSATGQVPSDERDSRGVSCLIVLDEPVDLAGFTLQFRDTGNTDGYFQFAMLWAGMSARPAFAPIAGNFQIDIVEEARQRRSLGGTLHSRRLWARRRITAALEYSEDTEALAIWLETTLKVGRTSPVLFSVLPPTHVSAIDQPRTTVLGNFIEPPPVSHQTVDLWRWTFSIVEL